MQRAPWAARNVLVGRRYTAYLACDMQHRARIAFRWIAEAQLRSSTFSDVPTAVVLPCTNFGSTLWNGAVTDYDIVRTSVGARTGKYGELYSESEGERSPGADVGGGEPVPMQMWERRGGFRCRCGKGALSPAGFRFNAGVC